MSSMRNQMRNIRVSRMLKEDIQETCEESGIAMAEVLRICIADACSKIVGKKNQKKTKHPLATINFAMTKEELDSLNHARIVSGKSINKILDPYLTSLSKGLMPLCVQQAHPPKMTADSCCEKEVRNDGGSCINCGDPCL